MPSASPEPDTLEHTALRERLTAALAHRAPLADAGADARHESAFRLFNGFLEGEPRLVAEIYARTLVLHNHADPAKQGQAIVGVARSYYLEQLPWIQCVLVKARYSYAPDERRGVIGFGVEPDTRVVENDVRYALDLRLSQDTSFYLDTRHLREWARRELTGKTVLNTFAYTGSLGVAARAGGAPRVVHTDRNRAFLNLAKESYTLNGFPIHKANFIAGDFFSVVNGFKKAGVQFECVFLDAPHFSATHKGRVDLVHRSDRLINKVRPLVADGGRLVAINNALFVSGAEYVATLEALCADGYLSIEQFIPVPQECIGYEVTRPLPANPAPFNHATKIAVLRVRRK
ncbi:MAG: class I SAM-dependent methyltransferase [Anaerolineales bacterium]